MSVLTVHENLIWDALREATEKIKAGMDLEKAKRIIQERLGMAAIDGVELHDIAAVAHEGQPAFRCRMTVHCDVALILDCHGNCVAAFPENSPPPSSAEQRIEDAGHQAAHAQNQF
jgi:hypothetical protein